MKRLKEKIEDWNWKITQPFRTFIRGCKNIYNWLPYIWKDRQWDHWYFYTIMEQKLNMMIQYYESGNVPGAYEGMEHDVKYMKIAKKLIGIIKDETYSTETFELHTGKWGNCNFNFGKPNERGCTELILKYEKVNTPEEEKEEKEDFGKLVKYSVKKQNKAKKLLWKIIHDKLDSWWD